MPILKRGSTPAGDGVQTQVQGVDVLEGEMTVVKVSGKQVVLTRYDGRLYAVDNACPHAAASLSGGSLNRWKLCCPDHGYCFDIRSGQITWPEDELYRLKRYEVWEEGGLVWLRFSPPS